MDTGYIIWKFYMDTDIIEKWAPDLANNRHWTLGI